LFCAGFSSAGQPASFVGDNENDPGRTRRQILARRPASKAAPLLGAPSPS